MTWVQAVLFSLVLGVVGEVPLPYGFATWLACAHHGGVNCWDVGALLLAENGGHGPYNPDERGRYNGGGEMGLFQLKAVWALEASERCMEKLRRGHHRYSGLPDCLWIDPASRVALVQRKRRRGLDEAYVNIEAAVIAFGYLRAVHKTRYRYVFDWRALFRCSPRAWKHPSRTRRERAALVSCRRSVARVERQRKRLHRGRPQR